MSGDSKQHEYKEAGGNLCECGHVACHPIHDESAHPAPVAPAAEGQTEDLTPVRNVMNRLRQLNPQSKAAELLDKLMQSYSAPSAPQSEKSDDL